MFREKKKRGRNAEIEKSEGEREFFAPAEPSISVFARAWHLMRVDAAISRRDAIKAELRATARIATDFVTSPII